MATRTRLTKKLVSEVGELLAHEDLSIWEVGDWLNDHPLSDRDLESLAEQVGRAASTLRSRASLAREFPGREWDRTSAAIGVFEHLARLKDVEERAGLLASRPEWTVNGMRREVDRLLDKRAAKRPTPIRALSPVARRVTRFDAGDRHFAMKSEFDPRAGELRLSVPGTMAAGEEIKVVEEDDGSLTINVPLDVDTLRSDEGGETVAS